MSLHVAGALHHDERQFRLFVEQSADMLSRHDAGGRYLYVSPAVRRLLGYEPEALLGRPVFELYHADDRECGAALHRRMLASREPVALTHRLRAIDGSYRWVECRVQAVRDPVSDLVIGVHAIARDVHAQHEAELALRASEERLRIVLERAPVGIVLLGPDGRIMQANPFVTRFVGLSEEELLGRAPWELPLELLDEHGVVLPPGTTASRRTLLTGEPVREHLLGMRIPGGAGTRWLQLDTHAIVDRAGQVAQVIVSFTDVSERREAERERERLIRELRAALDEVDTLQGLIPMCAGCRRIRDDQGYWTQLESYIVQHSKAEFTHSVCPSCSLRLYPDYQDDDTPG